MKAVVLKGTNQVRVEDVDDPKIERATDCIVRISSAVIGGSDLHMYEGRTRPELLRTGRSQGPSPFDSRRAAREEEER